MSVDDKVKHTGLLLDDKQVVWSFWFHSGSVSHGFVRDLMLSKCKCENWMQSSITFSWEDGLYESSKAWRSKSAVTLLWPNIKNLSHIRQQLINNNLKISFFFSSWARYRLLNVTQILSHFFGSRSREKGTGGRGEALCDISKKRCTCD